MRLDLPQELPRRRVPEDTRSAPPLEPSPVELRREALAARAADRRAMPQAPQNRTPHPAPPQSERHTTAPDRTMDQRPRREVIPQQAIGLSLREEERKVLTEVGRFRVVATRDLAETVYAGRHSRMERDLAFLREKGLVRVDTRSCSTGSAMGMSPIYASAPDQALVPSQPAPMSFLAVQLALDSRSFASSFLVAPPSSPCVYRFTVCRSRLAWSVFRYPSRRASIIACRTKSIR